jgi:Phage Tail Collar Domain
MTTQLDRRSFFKLSIAAVAAAVVPGRVIGAIQEVIPDPWGGWLFADGRELLRKDYPELFAVIGDMVSRDDVVFRLPDLRSFHQDVPDTGYGVMPMPPIKTEGGSYEVDPCHTHSFLAPGGIAYVDSIYPMHVVPIREFDHIIKVRDPLDDGFPIGTIVPYAGRAK